MEVCDYPFWSYGNTWAAPETEKPVGILKTALRKAALPRLQLQKYLGGYCKANGNTGKSTHRGQLSHPALKEHVGMIGTPIDIPNYRNT